MPTQHAPTSSEKLRANHWKWSWSQGKGKRENKRKSATAKSSHTEWRGKIWTTTTLVTNCKVMGNGNGFLVMARHQLGVIVWEQRDLNRNSSTHILKKSELLYSYLCHHWWRSETISLLMVQKLQQLEKRSHPPPLPLIGSTCCKQRRIGLEICRNAKNWNQKFSSLPKRRWIKCNFYDKCY